MRPPARRASLPLVRPSLAAAALALALPTGAQVLVVDAAGGPGTDFTDLQAAVDAALPGELVLVRSGTYGGLEIRRSASVVAHAGAAVTLQGDVLVEDLAPADRVLLSGLVIDPGSVFAAATLTVRDTEGRVWIQDCTVTGDPLLEPESAVLALRAASLVMARCTSTGFFADSQTQNAGAGLRAVDSSVHLFECTLRGGFGTLIDDVVFGDGVDPKQGAAGARVEGGLLVASGCTFEGGEGGDALALGILCTDDAGDGGAGLSVGGASPSVRLVEPILRGGPGGDVLGSAPCDPGDDGGDLDDPLGAVTTAATPARHYLYASPAAPGDTNLRILIGEPDDLAWLVLGLDHDAAFLPGLVEASYLPDLTAPFVVSFQGVVPFTGLLASSFTEPDLGLGAGALTTYEQAFFLDAADGFTGSTGLAVTRLGSAVPGP